MNHELLMSQYNSKKKALILLSVFVFLLYLVTFSLRTYDVDNTLSYLLPVSVSILVIFTFILVINLIKIHKANTLLKVKEIIFFYLIYVVGILFSLFPMLFIIGSYKDSALTSAFEILLNPFTSSLCLNFIVINYVCSTFYLRKKIFKQAEDVDLKQIMIETNQKQTILWLIISYLFSYKNLLITAGLFETNFLPVFILQSVSFIFLTIFLLIQFRKAFDFTAIKNKIFHIINLSIFLVGLIFVLVVILNLTNFVIYYPNVFVIALLFLFQSYPIWNIVIDVLLLIYIAFLFIQLKLNQH